MSLITTTNHTEASYYFVIEIDITGYFTLAVLIFPSRFPEPIYSADHLSWSIFVLFLPSFYSISELTWILALRRWRRSLRALIWMSATSTSGSPNRLRHWSRTVVQIRMLRCDPALLIKVPPIRDLCLKEYLRHKDVRIVKRDESCVKEQCVVRLLLVTRSKIYTLPVQ